MAGEATEAVQDPTIRGALARLGLPSASGKVLAVTASADTKLDPEHVWATWSKLDQWPRWSKSFVSASRWLEGRKWEVGAQFELVRTLGFPIGRQVTVETVREVNEGTSVAWWDGKGGSFRTCHIWFFESLPEGGTRIHSTEVLVGWVVALFKPLMRRTLTRSFEEATQALARAAEREHGH
jgi:hypothetical protein